MTLYIFKGSGLGISGGETLTMHANIFALRVCYKRVWVRR